MFLRKLVAACALLTIPVSCGDDGNEAQDEIEGTADCTQVCSRYNTCVDQIDQVECVDQCEDIADGSEAGKQSATDCEDCLDGKSCEESTGCWATCPVVPAEV